MGNFDLPPKNDPTIKLGLGSTGGRCNDNYNDHHDLRQNPGDRDLSVHNEGRESH